MNSHLIPSGLHVVCRAVPEKLVNHVAVLVSGVSLTRRLGRTEPELIVEFDDRGLHADAPIASHQWRVLRPIVDAGMVIDRIVARASRPRRGYDLLVNNCEHFVSEVETGKPHSPQVRGLAAMAGAVVAVLVMAYLIPRAARA